MGESSLDTEGSGLAFSPGGTLFFAGDDDADVLRTVNPATGTTVVVAPLTGFPGGTDNIPALAFHPNGTLFGVAIDIGVGARPTFLVTINTTTGAITSRGPSVNRLDAIAFVCPASAPPDAVNNDVNNDVNDPNNDDDEKKKETEEQRQQRERTNRGGRDDVAIEGNVLAVEEAAQLQSLLVTIGVTRKETVVVQVPCVVQSGALVCPDIRVGDYLEADGYQNGVGDPNNYFVAADGIEVLRNGKKVK